MQKIPNVGLYDTIGIYVAAFQHPNAFIPYLYIWRLSWHFLPDFSHISGDYQIHTDYFITRQTTVQTAQIGQFC